MIQETKGEFIRGVEFHAAFDKRHVEPNKNYGIHGAEMLFTLKGAKGVVQFLLYTNWHLAHVRKEFESRNDRYSFSPLPADIGYHSPVAMYEGQEALTDSCALLDGKPCFYDGSGLDAYFYFDVLIEKGDEGLWEALEKYYRDRFGG